MLKKIFKTIGIGILLFMGSLTLNVLSNMASSSTPVQKTVHNIELFVGSSILEKKPLIKEFAPEKLTYKMDETINFHFKLKEKSFVYLLNTSSKKSLLLPIDGEATQKEYTKNKEHTFPPFKPTQKGTEHFYLIASTSDISSDLTEFKEKSMAFEEAKALIENLKNSNMIDIYRVDVEVE